MNDSLASRPLASTGCGYDHIDFSIFLYRIMENDSTTSGSDLHLVPDLPTGAVYSAPPIEILLYESDKFIKDIASALPAVDSDLDEYVDQLVEKAYLKAEKKPLARNV